MAADGDESFTRAVGAEGLGMAPCSSQMHKSQADAVIRVGKENQPEVFQTWTSAWDVNSKMLVFQDLEGLTEVFGGMSAGMSCRKLPLWAEFSFLKEQVVFSPTVLPPLIRWILPL